MNQESGAGSQEWPALPLEKWQSTYDTLHLWAQIVGKIRSTFSPPVNHWWHVPLYVAARGLTTSPIPYGSEIFEIRFDFLSHRLVIETSTGRVAEMALEPMSVAAFYRQIMARLASLDLELRIHAVPDEIENAIPFEEDDIHASYDPEYVGRFWRILVSADSIFKEFRGRFMGKCSPVHFFWGSFDLAVTRFSGLRAPERPDADPITREAYSHEVISAGFWPGGGEVPGPAFYAYAVPEPPGLKKAAVLPAAAFWHTKLSEFLLMYDDVRLASSPRKALLAFLQSTYEAGAELSHWDRSTLERPG
jgi:hypothetical protein